MKKLAFGAVVILSVLLMWPAIASAQKVRIAIWDFENNSERHWWFSDNLGPAARNVIDNAFSENRTLSEKFTVVEREKLQMVLKEQGLSATGALNPQTTAKVGQILGIQYIVTGAIDKFSLTTTKGAVSRLGVGGNLVQAETVINLRFIDATTAERVVAVSAEGEVRKGGGFFRGNELSRDAQWGVASEAVEKASQAVVAKLASGGYLGKLTAAVTPAGGLEGKIVKVEGSRAWVNLGSTAGLRVGDKFLIFQVGEELIDPDTGVKLGADEQQTGSGEVTEVQEKFAVINFSGTATARDVVRKQK
jgi:curli biogenesis system outer membrane secretion channel CsgG